METWTKPHGASLAEDASNDEILGEGLSVLQTTEVDRG